MSIWRKAAKRDTVEPEIVDTLQKMGATTYRLSKPVDLVVGYRGRTYLVEVKTGKGSLTASQIDFMETWRGGQVHVLRTPQEAIDWIKSLFDPALDL
jgi:hypothetical protein